MKPTGTFKLKMQPFKKEKSWQIIPKSSLSNINYWVPFSIIKGYTESTLEIEIELWWLKKNNITI